MAGGWEIREGTREDLPDLEHAWRSLFAHHAKIKTTSVPVVPVDERWPARLREFQEAFDRDAAVMLVAEREGEFLGFAFSTLHDPHPVFLTGPMAELDVLVVLPGHRGKGIGDALVRGTASALRGLGVDTLKVVVMAGNDDALRFYRRLGIEPALIDLLTPLDAVPREAG